MKSVFRNSTIVNRLLSIFVISLLIIFTFSGVIFNSMRKSIEDEIVQRSQSMNDYAVDQVEALFLSILHQGKNWLDNEQHSMISFAFLEENENEISYWMTARSIIKEMKASDADLNGISDIVVYYPSQLKSVSLSYGLSDISALTIQNIIDEYDTQNHAVILSNGKLKIYYPYPSIARIYPETTKLILSLTISETYLEKMLNAYKFSTDSLISVYRGTSDNVLFSCDRIPSEYASDLQNFQRKTHDGKYVIVQSESKSSDFIIVQLVPLAYFFSKSDMFSKIFYIFLLFCLPLVFLIILAIHRLVKQPLDAMHKAFARIAMGDIAANIDLKTSSEFSVLIDDFNRMASQLQKTIDQLYKEKIYSKEMEFKQLQSQINPHFLYNGFYILKHQIQSHDWEGAEEMTSHMASYFQYICRNGKQEVELQEEWNHCKDYLAIQETRFGFRLTTVQPELPEKIQKSIVPRLILQPLLENALNYGVKNQTENSIVSIKATYDEKNITIAVEDSGTDFSKEKLEEMRKSLGLEQTETTALINIHKRMILKYGKEHGLLLEKSDLGGLKVIVSFPYQSEKKE